MSRNGICTVYLSFGLYFDGRMLPDNWSTLNVVVKCSSCCFMSGAWCFVYFVAKLLVTACFVTINFLLADDYM